MKNPDCLACKQPRSFQSSETMLNARIPESKMKNPDCLSRIEVTAGGHATRHNYMTTGGYGSSFCRPVRQVTPPARGTRRDRTTNSASPQQKINEKVRPMLNCLGRLKTRMEKTGRQNGKLYQRVAKAYDAVHALSVDLH